MSHAGEVLTYLVRSEEHRLVENEIKEGEPTRPLSSVRADTLFVNWPSGCSVARRYCWV